MSNRIVGPHCRIMVVLYMGQSRSTEHSDKPGNDQWTYKHDYRSSQRYRNTISVEKVASKFSTRYWKDDGLSNDNLGIPVVHNRYTGDISSHHRHRGIFGAHYQGHIGRGDISSHHIHEYENCITDQVEPHPSNPLMCLEHSDTYPTATLVLGKVGNIF